MKKRDLTKLALLGIASTMMSTAEAATAEIADQAVAAHAGCGSNGCSPRYSRDRQLSDGTQKGDDQGMQASCNQKPGTPSGNQGSQSSCGQSQGVKKQNGNGTAPSQKNTVYPKGF